MFKRNIAASLMEWKNKKGRKPLIIRGARQVGKTSAVHKFGVEEFATYVYINLELEDNAALFARMQPVKELLQLIQLKFNKKISPGSTLVFIDEVQNSDIAMNQLRYFLRRNAGSARSRSRLSAGSQDEVRGFFFSCGTA